MPLNNSKPIIYLAFANDRSGKEDYLTSLKKERVSIRRQLKKSERAGLCEVYVEPDATIDDVFAFFNAPENRNRIVAFHYAGHASGRGLHLESDNEIANKLAHGDGLAELYGSQKNLQLIFLNGCSTQAQGKAILQNGVKNVITTSTAIADDVAVLIANHFYEKLAGNGTIAEALKNVMSAVKSKKDDNPRGFYLPGVDLNENPWHLMTSSDTSADWKLTQGGAVYGEHPEIEVFVGYSPDDHEARKQLKNHVKLLQRQKLIKTFSVDEIKASEEINKVTKTHLSNARIILLLVSAGFMVDCEDIDRYAMEAHEEKLAAVIPVFIEECDLTGAKFTKLQGLPRHHQYKFVSQFPNKAQAYTNIAKGLREVVESMLPPKQN